MKNQHGGKRPAAGQPKKAEEDKRVTKAISFPPKLLAQLDELEGTRSANVVTALVHYYDFER
jgi:hypothetical protein